MPLTDDRFDLLYRRYHEDPIQVNLDAVSYRLAKPSFLRHLTPSRLPSQAASEASLSPPEASQAQFHARTQSQLQKPRRLGNPYQRSRSPLDVAVTQLSLIDDALEPDVSTFILRADNSEIGEALPISARQRRAIDKLRASFLYINRAFAKMTEEKSFQSFEHGHQDLVLAVDYNFYGTRMVTASSDHHLKVWDRKDQDWILIDSWKGHEAEVVGVRWNGPFMGEVLGSIGEDGEFKLWEEDIGENLQSGRRFKLIYSHSSPTKIPFMSLDFKNINTETYLALITRDGFLMICEPVDHDNLSDWRTVYTEQVRAVPSLQEEASFRVAFHREKLPCYTAVLAGLDRKALSLAVAAMDIVKIYRTDKDRELYVAAELTGARGIIRDVAWANGSVRGYDLIATACKDGMARVYELTTSSLNKGAESIHARNANTGNANGGLSSSKGRASRTITSGISSELANVSRSDNIGSNDELNRPDHIKHNVKLVAELKHHYGAVWRVAFSPMGDILVSTGDDGTARVWKKAIDSQWLEYAELDVSKDT